MIFSDHAIERFQERVAPQMTFVQAKRFLTEESHRASRTKQRTHNGQLLWKLDNPSCLLVTKHDPKLGAEPFCVTILEPESEEVEEEVDEDDEVDLLEPQPSVAPTKEDKKFRVGAEHAAQARAFLSERGQLLENYPTKGESWLVLGRFVITIIKKGEVRHNFRIGTPEGNKLCWAGSMEEAWQKVLSRA